MTVKYEYIIKFKVSMLNVSVSPCPSAQVQLNFNYCTEMPSLLYLSISVHSVLTSVPLIDCLFFSTSV